VRIDPKRDERDGYKKISHDNSRSITNREMNLHYTPSNVAAGFYRAVARLGSLLLSRI
jgi:hypothetical protein